MFVYLSSSVRLISLCFGVPGRLRSQIWIGPASSRSSVILLFVVVLFSSFVFAPSKVFAAEVERPYPWVKITKVIKVGEPAPGLPGQIALGMSKPQIDGQNKVMFWLATAETLAIYYGGPDDVWPVVKKGDPVPGVPGATIAELLGQPTLSEDGTIAVGIEIEGPDVIEDVNDGGLLMALPPDEKGERELRLAFRAGDPLPQLGPGYAIASSPFQPEQFWGWFNEVGEFRTRIRITGPGVTLDNDDIWCWGDENELNLILRQGDPAPGLPGVFFFAAGSESFNDRNEFLFRAPLFGDIAPENDRANCIWSTDSLLDSGS